MPLLTPNSYGTAKGELREYNPCHEPAGSRVGGRFARKGSCTSPATVPAATTAQAVASFEVRGDGDTAARLKDVFGRAISKTELEAVARQMLGEIEGVSFNVIANVRDLLNANGEAIGSTVIFRFIGTDGDVTSEDELKRPTSLVRAFQRKDGKLIVGHSSFEKNRNLPAGFGKDMLRGHMQAYQRLGVDRIETHANIDIGAYAWAKYGFVAMDPGEITSIVGDALAGAYGSTVYERDFKTGMPRGKGVGMGDSEIALLKGIVRSKDPRAIWAFADATIDGVKVGKALLAQTEGWGAYLDITGRTPLSRASLDRFWAYVGRTKRPATAAPARSREAEVRRRDETETRGTSPGELCEWDPIAGRYTDARIWETLLDGDSRFVYDLRDPSQRRANTYA